MKKSRGRWFSDTSLTWLVTRLHPFMKTSSTLSYRKHTHKCTKLRIEFFIRVTGMTLRMIASWRTVTKGINIVTIFTAQAASTSWHRSYEWHELNECKSNLSLGVFEFDFQFQNNELAGCAIISASRQLWWFTHLGHLAELLGCNIIKLLHHAWCVDIHQQITLYLSHKYKVSKTDHVTLVHKSITNIAYLQQPGNKGDPIFFLVEWGPELSDNHQRSYTLAVDYSNKQRDNLNFRHLKYKKHDSETLNSRQGFWSNWNKALKFWREI